MNCIINLIWILLLTVTLAFAQKKNLNQPFQVDEATIANVHQALKVGRITCSDLVKEYIQRIKKYNLSIENQPPLNATVEINPYMLTTAHELDLEFSRLKKLRGPLHCIPILLKDNIDTYDGKSTSGSLSLLGNQPNQDAELVGQLRKSGALILAKGTMDEFAAGLAGISSRSGRTGNSYNPSQNPGGSSGGPAVGVSANFAMLGIGTDNSGSVRIPAALNGLAGLRPSQGLISQKGIFPRGNIDGTAGPIARTIEDLAIVFDVIIVPNNKRPSYQSCLEENGLQGKRIGIVTQIGNKSAYGKMPNEIKNKIEGALQTMHALGAEIIRDINLSGYDRNRKLNEAGEREDINHYLASFPATRKNYQDICTSDRTRTFGNSNACLKFIEKLPSQADIEKAQMIFAKNKKYIEGVMNKYKLDALFIPVSTQGIAKYEDTAFVNELLASNAGLPGLTFNIGYTDAISETIPLGMPIGAEFVGRQFSECTLFQMAYAWQKKFGPRLKVNMPKANERLNHLNIAELNNLYTRIGYVAYQDVLKKSKPKNFAKDLSASVFTAIVKKELDNTKSNTWKRSKDAEVDF